MSYSKPFRWPERSSCHTSLSKQRSQIQGLRPPRQGPREHCRCTGAQAVLDQPYTLHRRVALFVEPSPFVHVSTTTNRYESLIQGLQEAGDDVMVFTPDTQAPASYHGAKVVRVLGFPVPFYESPSLLVSLGLSVRVFWHLVMTRPHIIHASSPGPMVLASILYAKLLAIPLVVSYHTPIPRHPGAAAPPALLRPLMWGLIRFCTSMADLTLVTSSAVQEELASNCGHLDRIDIWSPSTAQLREQQYLYAVSFYASRHMWKPLRIQFAALLRNVFAAGLISTQWLMYQLDYARSFRPAETYQ